MHITEAQAVYLEKFLNFRGNIAELAAAMDIPLVDMIDILSAPAVQKRIKAAAKLTKLRRKMIVADIEITALETLEQVAANKYADVVERRRAAAAILRALHKPKRRRSSNPRPPSQNRAREEAASPPIPPSQNRARQEAAVGQTTRSTHTPNPTDEDLPSPNPQLSPVASGLRPPQPDQTAINAAIYCPQEFLDELHETRKNSPASNMTRSQVCTTDLVEADALHPQDKTTKLLEETTQSLIELDELCAQDDQDDFDPTPRPNTSSNSNSQSRGIGVSPVPTSHSVAHASSLCESQSPPSQNRACEEASSPPIASSQNLAHQEAASGQTNHSTQTPNSIDEAQPFPSNPLPQLSPMACGLRPSQPDPSTPDQTLDDYDPETGLTTPIKNHISKHKNKTHPPPSPSDPPFVPSCLCASVPSQIDNPWESHPFARAGRSSNHDPP